MTSKDCAPVQSLQNRALRNDSINSSEPAVFEKFHFLSKRIHCQVNRIYYVSVRGRDLLVCPAM